MMNGILFVLCVSPLIVAIYFNMRDITKMMATIRSQALELDVIRAEIAELKKATTKSFPWPTQIL